MVTRKEKYTFHYNELIDASPRFTVGKFNKGDFVRVLIFVHDLDFEIKLFK